MITIENLWRVIELWCNANFFVFLRHHFLDKPALPTCIVSYQPTLRTVLRNIMTFTTPSKKPSVRFRSSLLTPSTNSNKNHPRRNRILDSIRKKPFAAARTPHRFPNTTSKLSSSSHAANHQDHRTPRRAAPNTTSKLLLSRLGTQSDEATTRDDLPNRVQGTFLFSSFTTLLMDSSTNYV